MDDWKQVVRAGMKGPARVRVQLHADAGLGFSEVQPEIVQPAVVDNETAAVRVMLRMHNVGN